MESETLSFDLHVLTYATFVSQLLYYYYLYNLYYDHVLCKGTQLLVFKKYNLGINLIGLSSFILLHLSYTLLLSIWKSLSYLDLKNFPLTMFLHFSPLRHILDMNCLFWLPKIVSFFCVLFLWLLTLIFFLYFPICDLNHLLVFTIILFIYILEVPL